MLVCFVFKLWKQENNIWKQENKSCKLENKSWKQENKSWKLITIIFTETFVSFVCPLMNIESVSEMTGTQKRSLPLLYSTEIGRDGY